MDAPENEILRTASETTPGVNSIMGLLPRGLLESPRMMIRATEKGEPSKKKQMKPQNIQGLQKKIVKEVTSMKFTEKVISVLEPATNRAKAGNCSQLLEPHVAPPSDPRMLLQTNQRQNIKGRVEALEPQNYTETVKAIFDEARRAGDAREAERNMELPQPEANDNQTTHQLGEMLPGVTKFFNKAQKNTGGAKAPRNSTKIKKQKAPKPKPQRIEPIDDLCQPCLNGNNDGQEEEWGLPRKSYAG